MTVDWGKIVDFHREVIKLGEADFYSLPGGGHSSTRWSFLKNFDPDQMAGPWQLSEKQCSSSAFVEACKAGEHEELFLGAGCVEQLVRGKSENRPLFIREVRLARNGEGWQIQPSSGRWDIAPTFFSLLDRMQIDPGGDVEDLGSRLIERAMQRAQREARSLTDLLRDVIKEAYPQVSERLISSAFGWVVFGHTNKVSPFNVHLMRDYDRLADQLSQKPKITGGLRVLEGLGDVAADEVDPPLDFIPLNPSQRDAVKGLLGAQHVSVISGPPGCGKSQVVVSTLLNAWARGQKVLFASNNNQAVDVVLDRLERFEAKYPVAVRAGSAKFSRVIETLKKTLAIVERYKRGAETSDDSARIDDLQAKKLAIQEMLDGGVPAQVDQQLKSALKAYGEFKTRAQEKITVRKSLEKKLSSMGVGSDAPSAAVVMADGCERWLEKISSFESRVEKDLLDRQEFLDKRRVSEQDRKAGCEAVGLDSDKVRDWTWLLEEGSIQRLEAWWQQYQEAFDRALEQDLEEPEWSALYDKWASSSSAAEWATKVRNHASSLRADALAFGDIQQEIARARTEWNAQRELVESKGVSTYEEVPVDVLRDWADAYKAYAPHENGWLQWVPILDPWFARTKFKRAQGRLRKVIPIALWKEALVEVVGPSSVFGPVVEALLLWDRLQGQWDKLSEAREKLSDCLTERVNAAMELGLDVPEEIDLKTKWSLLAGEADSRAEAADAAVKGWEARERYDATVRSLKSLSGEFERIGLGMPIRDVFFAGDGRAFAGAISQLGMSVTPESVRMVRQAQYEQSVPKLLNAWRLAWEHHRKVVEWDGRVRGVPALKDRLSDWWGMRPGKCIGLGQMPETFPTNGDSVFAAVKELSTWAAEWRQFVETDEPSLDAKIVEEKKWAVQELQKAVESVPESEREEFAVSVDGLVRDDSDWPTAELARLFKEFSPARLKARMDALDSQLESISFTIAKDHWLERSASDGEGLSAVSQLSASLAKSRLVIRDQDHGVFGRALDILPIWIVTGQSAHTLPVVPECFDLILIDEASQCTLTNLLPLLYRAKRVGIIGDPNQLPAIPVINALQEQGLLQRLGIDDGQGDKFGHSGNDVYMTGVSCLPNREGDVISLIEHYRSHPLIIGFSNQYIYHQSLRLRRSPFGREMENWPPGVYQADVHGQSERSRGSWRNRAEAEEVISRVRMLRADSGRRSIGVVTPFRAQQELIGSLCESSGLDNVHVGTAYKYQGDERDIMVFSPVVAPGMPPGTASWAGNPNQVNVAATRAREVFILVGHLSHLASDDGILGDLARYCQVIEDLRKTSLDELRLYSHLTLEGISSKVHPAVGDLEVDFVVNSSQGPIAIEVDGPQHANTKAADAARDAFLQASGYTVLRFKAREVRETIAFVMNEIKREMGLDVIDD